MRKIIIAGNWKMHKTSFEAIELANGLKRELIDIEAIDIVVCPPFSALTEVSDVLLESNIKLGAQNIYWEDSGAFTGEVSAPMVKATGAEYVILGHSERRQLFFETNESVNRKVKAALKHHLTPIVCIGETLKEREENRTFSIIKTQCEGSLAGLNEGDIQRIVIAYEPVWAIGTGKTATTEQAQEVHHYVRELLTKIYNQDVTQKIRIQYGGSVKPENAAELMAQPDIDGALVGGASLLVDSFAKIITNCLVIKK